MEIYIAKNKTQMGPYDAGQISQMLDAGLLEKHDLYWHEGMLDWLPIAGLKIRDSHNVENVSPPKVMSTQEPIYQNQPSQQFYQNQPSQPFITQQYVNQIGQPVVRKSRVAFVLLGLFLGGLGIHNFYAGYSGKGAAQLILTLFSPIILFLPIIVVGIWVIVEVCTITKDAYGVPFS